VLPNLEIAADNTIDAKTTTEGGILLKGAGAFRLQNINATGGKVDVISANDIVAENVVISNIDNEILHQTLNGDLTINAFESTLMPVLAVEIFCFSQPPMKFPFKVSLMPARAVSA